MNEQVVVILNCGDQLGTMKQAIDHFYEVFQQYSAVTINDQNDLCIYLTTGKAISPSQAAHDNWAFRGGETLIYVCESIIKTITI